MSLVVGSERKWFVVFTQQQREELAARSLKANKIQVFFPQVRKPKVPLVKHRRSGKKIPLFPRYLFARFFPEDEYNSVQYARGVVRILGQSGTPQPVNDEIVESIRNRLDSDGYFPLKSRSVGPGDQVVVDEGPFIGLVGQIERELYGGRRVTLFLKILDEAKVIIEKNSLSLVPETT